MFKTTLKLDNLNIPQICPNCLAPATTLYHEGFWGFGFEKVLAPPARYRCGSFYYCDYCGTQNEVFYKIYRRISWGINYLLVACGVIGFAITGWYEPHWSEILGGVALGVFSVAIEKPLARWIVRRKYPPREGQAVFARPAAKSVEMFGTVTFEAARQEWLTKLVNLNEHPTKATT